MMTPTGPIHSTAFFVKIWIVLLVLMGLSLLAAGMGHTTAAISTIFLIAAVKALLVLAYYMGLAWEPKAVWAIGIAALACVVIFFVVLIPDIVYVYGD